MSTIASLINFVKNGTADENARKTKPRSGLDFCTDGRGQLMDCDLFAILGMDQDDADIEYGALEDKGTKKGQRSQKGHKGDHVNSNEPTATTTTTSFFTTVDGEVIELDDHPNDERSHVSWKTRPKRGTCFDNDSGYAFECNLVQVLDDGLVLIEDMRAGGAFAAQPKNEFTTRQKPKRSPPPQTPQVLNGSGLCDPNEDFRTNILLNLEGI